MAKTGEQELGVKQATSVVSGAKNCPVCGVGGGRITYPDARDPITSDRFAVLECPSCGVAYTAPRPENLDDYYPAGYRGYGSIVSRVLGYLYDWRVAHWTRLRRQPGTVLEIGCGPGLMLGAFRRRGWRAMGIERNEEVAAEARRSQGVEVVTTPVEGLPPDARFDLIVMFNVLEHIAEPVLLLRQCARRLNPGGRVLINVPNFASWQARFAGRNWFHLDVPRHLTHFTPQTLSMTLERAGLRLITTGYVSLEHDPYGWIESTINCSTGRRNTLTRYLMGIEPFGPMVMLSCALGVIFALPALLLSVASWLRGRGALMEVVAMAEARASG